MLTRTGTAHPYRREPGADTSVWADLDNMASRSIRLKQHFTPFALIRLSRA